MTDRSHIIQALQSLQSGGFGDGATKLLDVLGYRSSRVVDDTSMPPEEFIDMYNPHTLNKLETEFISEARSVQILFQVTDTEMDFGQIQLDVTSYDKTINKSFLFVAVELDHTIHPRGRYAAFTRVVNRQLMIPAVVLFRTPDSKCTLGFVHRRESIRDPTHHVLEQVSLIREIRSSDPHRAHVDTLYSLSMQERLAWIDRNGKQRNFDGLLHAWLTALDTEELNKRFYRDLYGWFERAVHQAILPKNIQPQEHILRLITRLLFVWFIKQKGLINDSLFNEYDVKDILVHDGSYYRAILQNLFFATLNTEIKKRGFGDNNTSYHYKHEIKDAETLMDMFNQTPFINGGLFECLDDHNNRSDYFVDDASERRGYHIPNHLFFGDGDNPGLITIFNKYHFTVEESTPLEQEVALDPELLGKVFENLLAAYNPETGETVRKQTGSYYTPREVVDYIVDKTLAASITGKVYDSAEITKMQKLLDYSAMPDDIELTDKECSGIVQAISNIKILDPAVGSGAFLMSVLHKLTLVLNRVDPANTIWMNLQIDMAKERAGEIFEKADTDQREEQLHYVNTVFERYSSDYGRKLYLIQNNIYGVDIQPIAIQITKLRFFISLAIEQSIDNTNPEDNYGVQPLPNLETRFVAANTVVPLIKTTQQTIGQTDDDVRRLESELARNREQYFLASHSKTKIRCRDNDAKLRNQLINAMNKAGDGGYVTEMVKWDPYDQNHSSGWFDAKYMFGVSRFDVVVGNPPYLRQTSLEHKDNMQLSISNNLRYTKTIDSKADISIYFFIHSLNILKIDGLLGFINTDSWLHFKYGEQLQAALLQYCDGITIVRPKAKIFHDAQIRTVVTIATRSDSVRNVIRLSLDFNHMQEIRSVKEGNWLGLMQNHMLPEPKIGMTTLGNICNITSGIETGHDAFYILSDKDVATHRIDKKYHIPILTKPIEGHVIHKDSPHMFLFHVSDYENELGISKKGRNIKQYIDHGNPKGHAKKDKPRYYISVKKSAPILISMQINEKVQVYENVARMAALRKFTYVTPKKPEHVAACLAYLSSSFFALYQEIWGHPMGGGLLKFQIVDYNKAIVPDFSSMKLDKLSKAWESYKKTLNQHKLDKVVFDVMGIENHVHDVMSALSNMTSDRLTAASPSKKVLPSLQ